MKPVGQIEPEEPKRKAKATIVRPGTRAYVINEWLKYAASLDRRPGNEKIRNGTLNRLHGEGYTWEQVEKLVRVFFTRYAQDIRAKRDVDLARMFAQQLNQGLESVAEVQTPPEEDNKPRPYTTGAEIAERWRAKRETA